MQGHVSILKVCTDTNILKFMYYIRCNKKFYTCLQIFYYNPESNEDIHLAHIEPQTRHTKPLNDPYTAIVFQPMANGLS